MQAGMYGNEGKHVQETAVCYDVDIVGSLKEYNNTSSCGYYNIDNEMIYYKFTSVRTDDVTVLEWRVYCRWN